MRWMQCAVLIAITLLLTVACGEEADPQDIAATEPLDVDATELQATEPQAQGQFELEFGDVEGVTGPGDDVEVMGRYIRLWWPILGLPEAGHDEFRAYYLGSIGFGDAPILTDITDASGETILRRFTYFRDELNSRWAVGIEELDDSGSVRRVSITSLEPSTPFGLGDNPLDVIRVQVATSDFEEAIVSRFDGFEPPTVFETHSQPIVNGGEAADPDPFAPLLAILRAEDEQMTNQILEPANVSGALGEKYAIFMRIR